MKEIVLSQGGYKKACSSIFSFLSQSSHSLLIHLVFPPFVIVVHHYILFYYLLFNNYSPSKLFVPIKVPHCRVMGMTVRCA